MGCIDRVGAGWAGCRGWWWWRGGLLVPGGFPIHSSPGSHPVRLYVAQLFLCRDSRTIGPSSYFYHKLKMYCMVLEFFLTTSVFLAYAPTTPVKLVVHIQIFSVPSQNSAVNALKFPEQPIFTNKKRVIYLSTGVRQIIRNQFIFTSRKCVVRCGKADNVNRKKNLLAKNKVEVR